MKYILIITIVLVGILFFFNRFMNNQEMFFKVVNERELSVETTNRKGFTTIEVSITVHNGEISEIADEHFNLMLDDITKNITAFETSISGSGHHRVFAVTIADNLFSEIKIEFLSNEQIIETYIWRK